MIVPLFALANAGIAINGDFLAHAYTSPVTLGILFGYLAGKPVGIAGGAWLVTKLTRGRLRPPVGWAAVAGGGFIAGIGFTVSLLISSLAFHGTQLERGEARRAQRGAGALARHLARLPRDRALPKTLKTRALLGTAEHARSISRSRSTPSATTSAAPRTPR